MEKDLFSKTKNSEKANLWNSVIKRGKHPLSDLHLTDERIEQIKRDGEKRQKIMEECSARGHPNSESQGMEYFKDALKVYMHCNNCGEHYHRSPTIKEEERFAEEMNRFVY